VVLDDSNILQADTTVIAGLLVLLTVAYYLAPKDPAEVPGKFAAYTVPRISRLVIIVVALFSVSAILVTLGNGSVTITLAGLGKYVMMVGLGALAVGLGWLLYGYARKGVINLQRGEDKDLNVNK
jgi:archaellum biogenesis protein FlaJ (TadC family)